MTGWAILFSALAMTAIVGVRYLITSGAFALATRVKHPGLYRGLEPQMKREIGWSLASAAIYGVPAGIVAWGWQAHGWTKSEERRVGKEFGSECRSGGSPYH